MSNKDFQNGFALGMTAKSGNACINKSITENGEYVAALEDEVTGYKQVQVDVTPRNSGLPLDLVNDVGELIPLEEVTDVNEDIRYIFPNISSTINGTPSVGGELTVELKNINKYCNFEYQWYNGKAVQAVETDSKVYIDTGYIPKTNTKIVMEYTKTVTQNENAIFGCNWSTNAFFLMHYNGNLRYHSKNTSKDFPESALSDKRHIEIYNGKFSVNNQIWAHTSCGDQTTTLKIFAPLSSNNYNYCGKFNFNFMKIYEYNSDTKQFDLVKYIIPTISQEAEHIDEVCLYDTVTNTYLYGVGTGKLSHNDEIFERTRIEGATDTTYTVKDTDEIVVCDVDGIINTECDYTSKVVKINGKPYMKDITDLTTTLLYDGLSVGNELQLISNFYDITDDNCAFNWCSLTSTEASTSTQLSNNRVYTLTENDIGKILQCTVNGKNHYIGSNSCSIPIPCTLTFMVNNEVYHTATGNTFEPPEDPTVEEGYAFYGWYDENDNKIEFPYQPAENKILYGKIDIKKTLTELENTNTTDTFLTVGSYTYKKAYNDVSILGMSTLANGYHNPVAVSRTRNGAAVNRDGGLIGTSIQTTTVNDETWYFVCGWGAQGTPILYQNTVNLNDYITSTGSETSIYGELAAQTLIKIYLGEIPLLGGNS